MFKIILLLYFFMSAQSQTTEPDSQNDTFPSWFLFGAATSSYQIEGGWNEDGKGISIWDTYTHLYPNFIPDRANGDIACDSYHRYREDIQLAVNMELNFYRFSISWPRIFPNGYTNYVNRAGVAYYNNLINDLISYNITPLVTIYHWDLPQTLQDIGGWPNPLLIDYFEDYARFLFDTYGDRVKTWITFNEPKQICAIGYGTIMLAPGFVNQSGIADYLCGHTVIRAHARVYNLYNNQYKDIQNGIVGITVDSNWFDPNTTSQADQDSAFRKLMFTSGWFINPIFNQDGNYPDVMIERIGNLSALQGFPRSRLPVFSQEEIEYIRGSYDFLGLNFYTSNLTAAQLEEAPLNDVSFVNDINVNSWQPASWINSSAPTLKITPWGMRSLLRFIKNYYGDFPIIITENGYADDGQLNDVGRVLYYKTYMNAIYQAMTEDNVQIKGYTAWSLLDNFEWSSGYSLKFGVNYVNFSDPARPRTPKCSAICYSQFIQSRVIDWNCGCNDSDFPINNN